MKIVKPVKISEIQSHLKAKHTGVGLDLGHMPGQPDEYRGFKVQLDAEDVNKLVLWWQFQDVTTGQTCRVTDLLQPALSKPRVQQFDPQNNGLFDLRTAPNLEPVIVADGLDSNFLYIIDGSHRTIAQHLLLKKDFQGVSAYICVHPDMLKWAYIPVYYKNLWKL